MRLVRTGHHRPPTEIDDQVPVEVFAEHWDGPTPATDVTVADVLSALGAHIPTAMVRVAVPTSLGHHRCLDILTTSVGPDIEGTPIELATESWDNSASMTIRDDEPVV